MLPTLRLLFLSALMLASPFVCGCTNASREKDWRAVPVLFDKFETVFYADAALLSSDLNGVPPDSRVLLQPFGLFRSGLRWLGEHVVADIVTASEGVLVGAKDFRPPGGLGPVQSTRCYVVMLRPGHRVELRKYFSHAPQGSVGGAPVWNWGAKLGEFGEGDPRLSSLYAGSVGTSYILISNDMPTFRSVAERLDRQDVALSTVGGIREWDTLRRYPEWGYRRYRHRDVINPMAAGMAAVPANAEALAFYLDLPKRTGVLRFFAPPDGPPEQPLGGPNRPPLKSASRGIWELVIPLDQQETSRDQCFIVVGLFGFALYL